MNKLTRRNLVKGAVAVSAGALIARVSHAQEILTEDDGTAVAMGYRADHTTVDTSVWTKKAGRTARSAVHVLRAVPGSRRRLRSVPDLCRQARPRSRLVQRLGAEVSKPK
jgi:hypothetical protein